MKISLIITAQYEENYGLFNNEPFDIWKFKGEQRFTLKVDTNAFMYGEAEVITAVKTLIASQSDSGSRYTYVSHELVFSEPIELSEADFEVEFEKVCKEGAN